MPEFVIEDVRAQRRAEHALLNRQYAPQPFEQLAEVLRKSGYDVEADHVAIRNREMRTLCQAEAPWRRFLSVFMDVTSRYGYSPFRATVVLGLYWLLGAAALAGAMLIGMAHLAPAHGDDNEWVRYLLWFGGALNGSSAVQGCSQAVIPLLVLDMIVPGLDLGQKDACAIIATEGISAGWFGAARAAYQMLGGVLAAITVTTYAGLLRKE